ncbi:nucleoside deaminase [Naasia lichenicola]|uniref:Nucleoside deaminase n=1 Tax=Naasia lichenicola TaxID=2565933 RepID=A0A4S4FU96_9MICO|nr:nucleoside deaminase [Naasia lichenicola]THG33375.1 nucleoside deaminase [Naasia lichenicola]
MAPTDPNVTESDLTFLRAAIALSGSAVANGNHPFGAVLVDATGTQVLDAENTVNTLSDATGHAETNLVRTASQRFTAEELRGSTLYTSCEPCAMCSGAIYWAGIGRMVYAMSEEELYEITGSHPDNPTLLLPSREVFARGSRAVEVAGPSIAHEARVHHEDFWH